MGEKLTVKQGDADLEIELPDGWISPDAAKNYMRKDTFEAELSRRVDGVVKNQGYRKPEDLLNDEEFAKTFIEKKGLNTDANAKTLQEQINRAKDDLLAREVKPRDEKITKAQEKINALLNRQLRGSILEAGQAAKVKPEFLKVPEGVGPNAAPPLVNMFRDYFGYSDEHDEHFVKSGENSFQFPTKGNRPYKDALEFFAELKQNPAYKYLFEEEIQGGPGAKPASGGGPQIINGSSVRISESDAKDFAKYRAAKAEAEKRGVPVEIVRS